MSRGFIVTMTMTMFLMGLQLAPTSMAQEGERGGFEIMNKILSSDRVLTGKMDRYTDRTIVVDGRGYSFCRRLVIFDPLGGERTLDEMKGAERLKLFINSEKGCVRKINILSAAQ